MEHLKDILDKMHAIKLKEAGQSAESRESSPTKKHEKDAAEEIPVGLNRADFYIIFLVMLHTRFYSKPCDIKTLDPEAQMKEKDLES